MTGPRPLLIAHDADLLEDVLRAAALAKVEMQVAADLVAARPLWPSAPLVLLDADLAAATAHSPPRRRRVVLVCRGAPTSQVWQRASAFGAELVVPLPAAEQTLIRRLTECVATVTSRTPVIGVIGGCGGAGATVLAAYLAIAAGRRPAGAMLIDLDPFGGGVDVALGLEHCVGMRWPDLTSVSSRLSPTALYEGLPRLRGTAVLSCGQAEQPELRPEVVRAVVTAARLCGGFVVVDLPRPPSAGGIAALHLVDDVLVVVPAEVRAILAARRVVAIVRPVAERVRTVVRVTGAVSPRRVAGALGVPLAGEIHADRVLQAAIDDGRPIWVRRRGPLSAFCDRLLDAYTADEAAQEGRAA